METIKSRLAGRKTYFISAGMILTALGTWLGDGMSTSELITAIFTALGLSALRAGVAKSGNGGGGQGGAGNAAGLGTATVLLVVCMGFASGCATVESGAYKALGSTSVLVDAAMQSWADYVVAGHASAADEARVKALYGEYQTAMQFCRRAVNAYRVGGTGQTDIEATLNVVGQTSAAFIGFIRERIK